MVRVRPFRALRPKPGAAARVASVPYDVVTTAEARALAADDPASFLHVIRPEIDLEGDVDPYADEVYRKARENLDRMVAEGLLVHDPEPHLYLYRQTMDGHSQTGVVGCCHVDDYLADVIKKHEKTRRDKEDDRTRHLLELRAHPGPVFLTYRDHDAIDQLVEAELERPPAFDFVSPDGVRHSGWVATADEQLVAAFAELGAAYVADGHHRSASAARAGAELRAANPKHTGDEEYNWFLTVLFPRSQLRILAYNRVVRDLGGLTADELRRRLAAVGTLVESERGVPDRPGVLCVYFARRWFRLELGPPEGAADPIASLDVSLLQDRVLSPILGIGDVRSDERVGFVGGIHGTDELERRVDSGQWAVALSLFPTSIEQLLAVADASGVMPPKSTWFEPKLRSGLFVHTFD